MPKMHISIVVFLYLYKVLLRLPSILDISDQII
jgi:hypothetical protein